MPEFEKLLLVAPQKTKQLFFRVTPGLNRLRSFADLTGGLSSQPQSTLLGFNTLRPQFGLVLLDDAAAAVLAFMALLMAIFLLILLQSPEFRKAVSVRAKELDRILKDLQINASIGLKESVDLIIAITNDEIEEQNRCRQSPTFQNSIDCQLAMQEFKNIVAKVKSVIPRLFRLVVIVTTNPRSGFDIRRMRAQFNKLLQETQQDVIDLQVSLANLRDKCKCPET